MNGIIHRAALHQQLLVLQVEDAAADIGGQKARVDDLGGKRQASNQEVRELLAEAQKLTEEAKELQEKANSGDLEDKFKNLFGRAAGLMKDAAKKNHAAEMAQIDCEALMTKAKQAGAKTQDALDRMQEALQTIQQSTRDLERSLAAGDRAAAKIGGDRT